jgi:uncharacterized Ntn-hydrolase superfamily protein
MTFAIVARCARTGQLGVGVASFSLGVGAYCPAVQTGVGALTSQSYSNPALKSPALRMLAEGRSPQEVVLALREFDPHYDFRTVGIVAADGTAAAWTGSKARPAHAHIVGKGYVAMGNSLARTQVIDAMAASFEQQPELELQERMLRALEACSAAGGQQYATGPKLPEHSAVIVVHDKDETPMLDLRVDWHETAIQELRRVRDAYRPLVDYYALRTRDPANTPTHQGWRDRMRTAG